MHGREWRVEKPHTFSVFSVCSVVNFLSRVIKDNYHSFSGLVGSRLIRKLFPTYQSGLSTRPVFDHREQ